MSVYDVGARMYAKAINDINTTKEKPVKKTGGLLQRNMAKQTEEKKDTEPYDVVLDAIKQIQAERRKFL